MFELLFVLMVAALIGAIAAVLVFLVLGHARRAATLLRFCVIGLAAYFTVLVTVSLVTPQRTVPLKADRCFDEWCVAVEDVTTAPALGIGAQAIRADGRFYLVTLRVTNRSRGRPQRAASAAIHLLDDHGRRYEMSPGGQTAYATEYGAPPPLTTLLQVGQSIRTVQVFDLPPDARHVSLTIEHPVGISPGWLIIGDEQSLLHKPTITRLP